MRHEFRRVFNILRPADIFSRGPRRALPHDIAFLADAHIDRLTLDKAARRSIFEGVSASRALMAEGGVSDTLYHLALAGHLKVPFIGSWASLASNIDPIQAIRSGRVRLAKNAPADWLIAPTETDVALLVKARALSLAMPRIAIATPNYLRGRLRESGRDRLAREASLGLPERAPHLSARGAADRRAAHLTCSGVIATGIGLLIAPRIVMDVFGLIFFAGTTFRLLVCAAGLEAKDQSPNPLREAELPTYTILVPLHHEVEMARDLVAALRAIDYPRSKLEVLFLTEQDDGPTRFALEACDLPFGFRVIALPLGTPRTKPRALNFGLMLARGTLVTVFDAEDRPEPDQLRKAAATFSTAPPRVGCLQARLAISNSGDGLLPSLFAMEYAALFDLFNIGLSRLRLPLPLGGTSNHFRANNLRAVGAWDAWNVTEDADLGLRLARFGFETRCLDTTTWETALESPLAWFKQRRRWTKGWMQTLLVLMRDRQAAHDLGWLRTIALALMLSNLVTGPLLLPFALCAMTYYVGFDGWPDPRGITEGLEATLAVSVAGIGVGSTLWCGAMGLWRRELHRSWRDVLWLLPYQLFISVAAWIGLWDLIRDPYYWHKTEHRRAVEADRSNGGLNPSDAFPFWRINRSSRAAPRPPRMASPRSRPG